MAFKREEIRKILGDAYTDEIGTQLVNLHRGVIDPIKDDLDNAKRDAEKYKADAEKLPGVQQELDELKKTDWKTKYENEHTSFESYKTQVAEDAKTAKVKAAYKKLLTEEKISEKAIDAVLNATDYSKMKLKDDGTLDGIEDLKKAIDTTWGGFKVDTRQRGEDMGGAGGAGGSGGGDTNIREMMQKMHEARYGSAPKD